MRVCKILFLVFLVFFTNNAFAQQEDQENAVKKVIEEFFKGLQNGDTTIVKATVKDPVLQTTGIKKDGTTFFASTDFNKFLISLANKKPEDKWEEKLLSYTIKIDGNMANVWTPYEFYLNSDFSHCGVNNFQLISFDSNWKIVYLIDTRRRKGCK